VTEQRLTLKRCVGRNVRPASLRGEGISLAVHDGGWQACRRATDGIGKRYSNAPPRLREASPSSHLFLVLGAGGTSRFPQTPSTGPLRGRTLRVWL
jgi:hypothetical protein